MPATPIEKAVGLLVVIATGALLRRKKPIADGISCFQGIILNALLPAVIYRALARTSVANLRDSPQYLAIGFTYCWFLYCGFEMLQLGTSCYKAPAAKYTAVMMFTSLAPGLTSFPYIETFVKSEYFGIEHAAILDTGNKIYVLGILGYVAGALHRQNVGVTKDESEKSNIHKFAQSAYTQLTKPINTAILAGIICACFGLDLERQGFFGLAIDQLAKSCTPCIFLLIGCKLRVPGRADVVTSGVCLYRVGLAFAFVGVLNVLMQLDSMHCLLFLFYCNSSLSFWPYKSMVEISDLERKLGLATEKEDQMTTFMPEAAMSMIPISFFITIVVNTSFTFISPESMNENTFLFSASAIFICVGVFIVKLGANQIQIKRKSVSKPKPKSLTVVTVENPFDVDAQMSAQSPTELHTQLSARSPTEFTRSPTVTSRTCLVTFENPFDGDAQMSARH